MTINRKVEKSLENTLDEANDLKNKFNNLTKELENNFTEFNAKLVRRNETLNNLTSAKETLDSKYGRMIELSRYWDFFAENNSILCYRISF